MANRRGYKAHAQYDPNNWKSTGPNKERKLDRLKYSLNENDYDSPEDFDFDLMLVEIISKSLEDIARYPTGHHHFKDAKRFIDSEYLDMWCIAFGRNLDTTTIRKKADDLIRNPIRREEYLRFCHDKTVKRYRKGGDKVENRGNNPKLQAD